MEPERSSRNLLPLGITLVAVAALIAMLGFRVLHARDATAPGRTADSGGAPTGMRWIAEGEFTMGTDDGRSMPNERPAHRVRVAGFWIDEHPVTNAEFRRFADATGYVTTAERKPDWEELRKELPPGTPKPDDSKLVPGSLVFTPPSHPVPLANLAAWS